MLVSAQYMDVLLGEGEGRWDSAVHLKSFIKLLNYDIHHSNYLSREPNVGGLLLLFLILNFFPIPIPITISIPSQLIDLTGRLAGRLVE